MATLRPQAPPLTDAPLDPAERLHALDVLRGFALLGMILVHFHQKMQLPSDGLEDLIGWFVYVGVEQKAWGTFALLFGVGFAIVLRRLEARGGRIVAFYLRRLGVLAAFGVVAEVFFGFHVLVEYAMWGVVLLLVRNWSTRALLALIALAIAAYPLLSAIVAVSGTPPAAAAMTAASEAAELAREGSDYATLLAARMQLLLARYDPARPGFWYGNNLALFIVGLLALRHGVFDAPRRHMRLIVAAMIFGAVSWAMAWLVVPRVPPLPWPALQWPVASLFGWIQDQWLTLTYAGGLVLLLAYRPVWQQRLGWIGFAGRMALTNYMLQAMVLDYLGSGYGVALRIRPVAYVAGAGLLFGVEAALSRWWLERYRFGPLEWVWRSLTYGRAQPMRRVLTERAATEPAPG